MQSRTNLRLDVYETKPRKNHVQRIIATYYPDTEYTFLSFEADAVTLGIVYHALQKLFYDTLDELDPAIANEIKETTRKAATGK